MNAVRRVRHRCDVFANSALVRESSFATERACSIASAQVIVAIRAVQDHKGASRQAIVKYLKAEFQCENGVAIKKALKSDKLVQTGQSFRVKGDAPIAPPADEVVGTEDVSIGDGAAAQKGDEVSMSYVGTLEADGSRFDAGKNFRFTLGAGPFRSRNHVSSHAHRSIHAQATSSRAGTGASSACASAAAASSSCPANWATARNAALPRYLRTQHCSST